MTNEQLREAVAKAMWMADIEPYDPENRISLEEAPESARAYVYAEADAAIALLRPVIRAEALEEAADAVGEIGDHADVGAYINAIRALKEKPNG